MNGSLDGVRVLDLSRVLAGPYCTMLLGDLGAEVIKVERPGQGDDLRSWGPPFGPSGDSTYFLGVNRNKKGVAVDLQTDAGREVVQRLAATCDVMVENFRVGMLDGLGLGYEQLREHNPGLVYCSVTGYGHSGPWASRPGYDVMLQAMGGLMSVTGEPEGQPMRVGVAIVDVCTGLHAAVGILSALQARAHTGRGQRVDLSLLATSLSVLPNLTAGYLIAGETPARLGTGHPNVTPYGVFATADSYVVIAVGTDAHWGRLCTALGHDETAGDSRYAKNSDRMARREEVEGLVRTWCAQHSTDELSVRLTEHDVPHGPVNTIPETLAHDQVRALGIVQDFPVGDGEQAPMVRSPWTFSDHQRDSHLPPPRLGADTTDVLRDLGLAEEEVQRLRVAGAFGQAAV